MTEQRPTRPTQRTNGYERERIRVSSDLSDADTNIRHHIKSEAVRVAPRTGRVQPSRNQKRTLVSADTYEPQPQERRQTERSGSLPLTQQRLDPPRLATRTGTPPRALSGQNVYVRQNHPNTRRSVAKSTSRGSVGGRGSVGISGGAGGRRGIGRIIAIVVIIAAIIALLAFILTHLPSCGKGETAAAAEEPARVSFVAVGDNLPDNYLGEWADQQAGTAGDGKYDYTSLFAPIASYVQAADLAYVKQETHCGGDEFGPQGYPSFNTTDAMADAIVSTGFDLVASATNHCYDYGMLGANEHSTELWATKDVVFTGTYNNAEAYNTIATTTVNGITFSLLDYTYGVNGLTEDELPPYTVKFINEEQIEADVARAEAISDVVMVAMHWGTENQFEPDEVQTQYAQLLADCGVDVILGSHPHVIGPMAWLTGSSGNKTLCAYSLGNFLSRHETPTRINELEGMLSCTFVKTPVVEEDPEASASPEKKKAKEKASPSASPVPSGSASTVTSTRNGYTITIENATWTPLVNHTNVAESAYGVYALKDYPESLAATHDYFDHDGAAALEWLHSQTREVVNSQGSEFIIDDTPTTATASPKK